MSMIECATNYVLVRPQGEPGRMHGIAVTDLSESHLRRSCVGVVVSVCPDLYYGGYDVLRAKGRQTAETLRAHRHSVQFDVPIEVKPGDRVIFESTVNVAQDTIWHEDMALFRYDYLLGRIEGENIYPLNGGVFIERFDSHYNAGGVATHSAMMPGYGRVVACGCRIMSYLMWPEKGADFDLPLIGRMIAFRAKHAVRIEHDAFRILQSRSQYPLYQLTRYSINAFLNELPGNEAVDGPVLHRLKRTAGYVEGESPYRIKATQRDG